MVSCVSLEGDLSISPVIAGMIARSSLVSSSAREMLGQGSAVAVPAATNGADTAGGKGGGRSRGRGHSEAMHARREGGKTRYKSSSSESVVSVTSCSLSAMKAINYMNSSEKTYRLVTLSNSWGTLFNLGRRHSLGRERTRCQMVGSQPSYSQP